MIMTCRVCRIKKIMASNAAQIMYPRSAKITLSSQDDLGSSTRMPTLGQDVVIPAFNWHPGLVAKPPEKLAIGKLKRQVDLVAAVAASNKKE